MSDSNENAHLSKIHVQLQNHGDEPETSSVNRGDLKSPIPTIAESDFGHYFHQLPTVNYDFANVTMEVVTPTADTDFLSESHRHASHDKSLITNAGKMSISMMDQPFEGPSHNNVVPSQHIVAETLTSDGAQGAMLYLPTMLDTGALAEQGLGFYAHRQQVLDRKGYASDLDFSGLKTPQNMHNPSSLPHSEHWVQQRSPAISAGRNNSSLYNFMPDGASSNSGYNNRFTSQVPRPYTAAVTNTHAHNGKDLDCGPLHDQLFPDVIPGNPYGSTAKSEHQRLLFHSPNELIKSSGRMTYGPEVTASSGFMGNKPDPSQFRSVNDISALKDRQEIMPSSAQRGRAMRRCEKAQLHYHGQTETDSSPPRSKYAFTRNQKSLPSRFGNDKRLPIWACQPVKTTSRRKDYLLPLPQISILEAELRNIRPSYQDMSRMPSFKKADPDGKGLYAKDDKRKGWNKGKPVYKPIRLNLGEIQRLFDIKPEARNRKKKPSKKWSAAQVVEASEYHKKMLENFVLRRNVRQAKGNTLGSPNLTSKGEPALQLKVSMEGDDDDAEDLLHLDCDEDYTGDLEGQESHECSDEGDMDIDGNTVA